MSAPTPDTMTDEELLDAFLGGQLSGAAAVAVSARLKIDPKFRERAADMVSIRALLMSPTVSAGAALPPACASTRSMLPEYRAGIASSEASRGIVTHLKGCDLCSIVCDLLSAPTGAQLPRTSTMRAVRQIAFALIGLFMFSVGFWAIHRPRLPDGPAISVEPSPQDAILAPAALLDELRKDSRNARVVGAVDALLTEADPAARNRIYREIRRAEPACPEPLLWALANSEPHSDQRNLAYQLNRLTAVEDGAALCAAIRRERKLRNDEGLAALISLLPTARTGLDRALGLDLLADVRQDPASDHAEHLRILQAVQRAFPEDDAIAAAVDQVSTDAIHVGVRALAAYLRAENLDRRGRRSDLEARLRSLVPALGSEDPMARRYAEHAFLRFADADWTDQLTRSLAEPLRSSTARVAHRMRSESRPTDIL